MDIHKERRAEPRLSQGLHLKIAQDSFELVTQTENISASGIYCRVGKPLPLMSKVEIALVIPVPKEDKVVTKKIKCRGVVVRSEPIILPDVDTPQQNIAIFFTDITQDERQDIEQYVNYQLLKKIENN
jgi:hypothetical protein